jgi:hypothetical protein
MPAPAPVNPETVPTLRAGTVPTLRAKTRSTWAHGCLLSLSERMGPTGSHPRADTSTMWPRASGRESELANACCECTVSTSAWCRGTGRDNSIGGDRFRLRWSNQGKRAEGCGCDLANNAAANQ